MDKTPYLQFLAELCEASSSVIRPYFANLQLEVETKADQTPVTIADRRAEEVLRDEIHKRFPSHGIIGEEYGNENENAEFVWMLDPIDGTKSFATACPLFGTLIALLHQGIPIVGAIHQPILNQLCIGDGQQSYLNDQAIKMRSVASFKEATMLVTDIHDVGRFQKEEGFFALSKEVKLFRTWGDCYGYLLLATGWADIMLDPIMNPWDLMPLIPIIEGAGGVISSWQGNSAVDAKSCVAANKALHSRLIEKLN